MKQFSPTASCRLGAHSNESILLEELCQSEEREEQNKVKGIVNALVSLLQSALYTDSITIHDTTAINNDEDSTANIKD